MNKLIVIPLFAVILLSIDLYAYQAFRIAFINSGESTLILAGYFSYHFLNPDFIPRIYRLFMLVGVFMFYFAKLFIIVFLVADDVIRLGRWAYEGVVSLFRHPAGNPSAVVTQTISRSEFLAKSALIAGALPVISMSYGILSGAHDYRVRKKIIPLSNLPKSFDGIKIGQISDIHSGSLFNKTAVMGGVELLMKEKPDIILFTGDLVNNVSSEMKDWMGIFDKLKAPLGVFSTLGNHDYGDYTYWPTREAKINNLKQLMAIHEQLGYDLLMNENRKIRVDGEEIALIGIENWGKGRFSKYGRLDEAYRGTEELPVKLLLSHDPSHWDAQVRPDYPDIDITFAGHTHGFQFGVEVGNLKWSPSQYFYKQWAGLYREGNQYLYVNRGFGCLAYPGRIGIPPELTIITLKAA